MLAVTAGGILVFSTLIGVIFTGIDNKLEELRKGRSFVVERGHTVIYGWSPEVFSIVAELVTANESRGRSCVAILAGKDKVEMEDEIRERVGDTKNTRVVCRSGDRRHRRSRARQPPRRALDHRPASGWRRRRLAGDQDYPGAHQQPRSARGPLPSSRGCGILRTSASPGWSEATRSSWYRWTSSSPASPPRRAASRARRRLLRPPGLRGDEIYFSHEPRLVGGTFEEAISAYEVCSVFGLRTGDGRILLNPPMDTRVSARDAIILIAEDDSEISLSENAGPEADVGAIRKPLPRADARAHPGPRLQRPRADDDRAA